MSHMLKFSCTNLKALNDTEYEFISIFVYLFFLKLCIMKKRFQGNIEFQL